MLLLCLGLLACGTQRSETTPPDGPRLLQTEDRIEISIGGRPVLVYQITPRLPEGLPEYYRRSGFLHPVYAPGGFVVTDDFPAGYAHQHGIFTAWTKTRFRGQAVDFWNQQQETGTVEHVEVMETNENEETAGFRVKLRQVSLEHGPVLEEEWYVRVHAGTDPFRWELSSVQTNITDDTLYLDRHIYGGLGIRGSKHWNASDSVHFDAPAEFVTSEGLDRATANHSRPEWATIYGDSAALKVIPSAGNFRAPQFVRVHPELPYMSVTPVVEEGFFIGPGEKYEMAFTFEVSDR